MPNFNSSDILISEANLLYAATGATKPDETTVDYGDYDSWTGWTHIGYTGDVSNMSYAYDVFSYTPEQATSPVVKRKDNEIMRIRFNLAQFSGDHLALVTGGTATDTAAGASQKGYSKIVGGGDTDISEYAFALEGYRKDASGDKQPVRIFFHKATISADGDIPFGKASATTVPVTVEAVADTSKASGSQLFEIHVVTAPATS